MITIPLRTIQARKLGSYQHDFALRHHCAQAGLDPAIVTRIIEFGVSWSDLFALLFKYGGAVLGLINDIITDVQKPGGITIADITTLENTYGPTLIQAVSDILAALGVPSTVVAPPAKP